MFRPKFAKKTGERKKKTDVKKLKEKLWSLCREIIKIKYGNTCYTCLKTPLTGSNWQTGHFIPSSVGGSLLRYDIRNLRPQCFRCNINLSGNGALFYDRLVKEEGQEYVDELFWLKNQTIKADEIWLQVLIDKYTGILVELGVK